MFCNREAKDNSEQNKVRRNKFLKDEKNMCDSKYSEHKSENSFDKNEDNK